MGSSPGCGTLPLPMTLSVRAFTLSVAPDTVCLADWVASLARAVRLSVVSSTEARTSESVLLVFSVAVCVTSRVRSAASWAALRASATGSISTSSERPLSGDRLSLMRNTATTNSAMMRMDRKVKARPASAVMGTISQLSGSRCTASISATSARRPKNTSAAQKAGTTSFSLNSLSKEKKKLSRFFMEPSGETRILFSH